MITDNNWQDGSLPTLKQRISALVEDAKRLLSTMEKVAETVEALLTITDRLKDLCGKREHLKLEKQFADEHELLVLEEEIYSLSGNKNSLNSEIPWLKSDMNTHESTMSNSLNRLKVMW